MSRLLRDVAVGLLFLASDLSAQEGSQKGKIKKVDAGKGAVTITVAGKDQDFSVAEQARFTDSSGNALKAGLKHECFKEGADVMFRTAQRDGKTVITALSALKVGGLSAGDFIRQPPLKVDMSRVKPLTDMGKDDDYKGFKGGLYPDDKNERPAKHEALGLALAREIRPLDKEGKPSADGKIVLLGVGMSNTTQAYSGFMRVARGDKEINPNVVLVDGALGGMVASRIQDIDGGRTYQAGKFIKYWEHNDSRLQEAGVTRAQVQVVWIKEADSGPDSGFPAHAQTLQAEYVKIMQLMHERFPNLKLVYVSNRTYGGWAKVRLNPEPYAYESSFAVKWLIEDQIKGNPELNCDPKQGPVRSSWLSWGPYLWANGTTQRADGFSYEEKDFRDDDGTHESTQGQDKVGRELVKFFKTDTTTRSWFVRK